MIPISAHTDQSADSRRWPTLLTPGPLTTSSTVKSAMQIDSGSRDLVFIELVASLRQRISDILDPQGGFTCVPIQGSGTYAVEAMLGTLIGPEDHLLVCANGAYGRRIAEIATVLGLAHTVLTSSESQPTPTPELEARLLADPAITHVAIVHCETTTGVLNPLEEVCSLSWQHGVRVLVDAMSSFGGIPLAPGASVDAVAASCNKCLQGVPGLGLVLVRPEAMQRAGEHLPRSVSLDLTAQLRGLEENGQFRFTPPTHAMWALSTALDELEAEGGPVGRNRRYRENHRVLTDGMSALGFEMFVDPIHQAPIIVTFLSPTDAAWSFDGFYSALAAGGYAIYPGKLTEAETFRIGCIGDVDVGDMRAVVTLIAELPHPIKTTRGEPDGQS
jgi:2-aminoethylphosphonate-pyruvate transaminase